jgi:hypothetical protein
LAIQQGANHILLLIHIALGRVFHPVHLVVVDHGGVEVGMAGLALLTFPLFAL